MFQKLWHGDVKCGDYKYCITVCYMYAHNIACGMLAFCINLIMMENITQQFVYKMENELSTTMFTLYTAEKQCYAVCTKCRYWI